jgi:hypothetical protein
MAKWRKEEEERMVAGLLALFERMDERSGIAALLEFRL